MILLLLSLPISLFWQHNDPHLSFSSPTLDLFFLCTSFNHLPVVPLTSCSDSFVEGFAGYWVMLVPSLWWLLLRSTNGSPFLSLSDHSIACDTVVEACEVLVCFWAFASLCWGVQSIGLQSLVLCEVRNNIVCVVLECIRIGLLDFCVLGVI